MPTKDQTMQELSQESFLSGGSDAYLDQLYENYLRDPANVSAEWQNYFKDLNNNSTPASDVSHEDIRDYFLHISKKPIARVSQSADLDHLLKQEKVINLIFAYRSLGHLKAKIDP